MQVYIASCTMCALLTNPGHRTDDGSAVSEVLIVCTNEGRLGWRTLQGECAACVTKMLKVELLV